MKNIILITILASFFISCEKEIFDPPACPGGCSADHGIYYKNNTINVGSDGFYRIKWDGLNYFQVKGDLSELSPQYVINKVPLIESNYDTDYWILIDTIRFTTPQYSYLGWFNDNNFNTPIPIGNHTYTMEDITDLHQPLNIAGYQINKHFCFDCPYAPTLLGTHSKYNYRPTQNILLDNEMVGDTINLFVETIFNNDPYSGEHEIINNNFKIIIE
tara:strand:+ start:638 stop:1285 length:648 start_codon:yes stop_codon:yes gene_type:complete